MTYQGVVNTINCHPFKLGDWIACHNGCISNSKELMGKARLIAKGETDSEEALAYVVSNNWSKESLREIQGGFAFVGIRKDLSKGVLVVDSYSRLTVVKIGTGYAWCSSRDWLESSLEAAGVKNIKDLEFHRMSSEMLHLETGEMESLSLGRWGMSEEETENGRARGMADAA